MQRIRETKRGDFFLFQNKRNLKISDFNINGVSCIINVVLSQRVMPRLAELFDLSLPVFSSLFEEILPQGML